jgi:hypothetical protein
MEGWGAVSRASGGYGTAGAVPRRSVMRSTFGVSIEELLGTAQTASKKRGPAPKLQQQIERIQRVPKAQQRFVMQKLDTVLQQADR